MFGVAVFSLENPRGRNVFKLKVSGDLKCNM